ncbi:hypothetical protein GCM10012279_05740 [Micromonospora yangpuensis]|nr:hypothetical protein GCM10012279_05740 [Micromonospora yangpuensis]
MAGASEVPGAALAVLAPPATEMAPAAMTEAMKAAEVRRLRLRGLLTFGIPQDDEGPERSRGVV